MAAAPLGAKAVPSGAPAITTVPTAARSAIAASIDGDHSRPDASAAARFSPAATVVAAVAVAASASPPPPPSSSVSSSSVSLSLGCRQAREGCCTAVVWAAAWMTPDVPSRREGVTPGQDTFGRRKTTQFENIQCGTGGAVSFQLFMGYLKPVAMTCLA